MKRTKITSLIFLCIFFVVSANGYAQTPPPPSISISKDNSSDPDNVCIGSTSKYKVTVANVTESYGVTWNPTNGAVEDGTGTISGATIKWNASTGIYGNVGKIKATLTIGQTSYNSNEISVTIKSIKHLTATFTGLIRK